MHPAAIAADDLLQACTETRTKRSGPGGQHRNKVETAVILHHDQTGVSAEASERRSQAANRRVALFRLRLRLALEHRQAPEPEPSWLWQSRVRDGRLAIAIDHDDYPALVAEALDRLVAVNLDMPTAAAAFAITPTQLGRLFEKAPAAWQKLNQLRSTAGMKPLR
ncbi:MAG: peptide chain release factor-like protein [Planctomycetota bacterium]|nr:MAG: peptide chain release factor-like protein [Planctomycetota bacterium]